MGFPSIVVSLNVRCRVEDALAIRKRVHHTGKPALHDFEASTLCNTKVCHAILYLPRAGHLDPLGRVMED